MRRRDLSSPISQLQAWLGRRLIAGTNEEAGLQPAACNQGSQRRLSCQRLLALSPEGWQAPAHCVGRGPRPELQQCRLSPHMVAHGGTQTR